MKNHLLFGSILSGRGCTSKFFPYGFFMLALLLSGTVSAQEVKKLALPEAIALGLQNSNSLKLSQARIDQAIAQYNQAKDKSLPTGSVSYTYNHAEIPTSTFKMAEEANPYHLPKRADAFLGTFSVQEVIFAGNKLRYAKESTELLTQAARLDAEKNREDIVYNITNAYYNLFKLQQSKKVVVQNLQAIDREIKQAQRFFEQGLVTKNDVLRFQLQRSDVELTGVDLETNRKIMVYNLNILLGLPENNDISVEEVHPPDVQATPVTAYIDSAVANRQELKSLALHSRIADNNIKSIRADVKPTVLLSTSAYYINPSGALIPPVNRFVAPVTAGATVAWNFDQLWLNKNKLSEAKIQRIQVDISNTLQKDQVRTEVNQNYQNYLKALEKIRILETALVQAQENNRMLESRYRNNVAPATDRIEAQTQLFQSQINLELARADAGIAYYTLLKSTGTLTRNK